MELHYIDKNGEERCVSSASELAHAIQSGHVTSQTMVRNVAEQKWMQAGDHPDCIAVSGGGTTLSSHEELRRARKLRRLGWLAWASGLAVIFLGGALANLGYYKVGEMTGIAFAAAILIAIYLASNRKTQAGAPQVVQAVFDARGGMAFAALCCAILVWNIYQTASDRRAMRNIAQRFESLANQADSRVQQSTVNAEAPKPTKQTSASGSDAERLEALMDDVMRRGAEIQNTVQSAYSSAAVDQVLLPSSIVTASGQQRARVALAFVKRALDNYEQELAQQYDDIPNMPERYGISRAGANEFRRGFANTAPQKRRLAARYIGVERKIFSKMEQIVIFIETRSPAPTASDGVVLFQDDEDANEYNRLVSELSDLGAEETAVVAEITQTARNAADKMKDFAEGS